MKVGFAAAARSEFDEAVRYYENARPGLGEEFKHEVRRTIDRIVVAPHRNAKQWGKARVRKTKRFPYAIIYVPEAARIVIVAVMHGSRRPGYWKGRLKGLGP